APQFARRCLRQRPGAQQFYFPGRMPGLAQHPCGDLPAEPGPLLIVVRLVHLSEHRESFTVDPCLDPDRDDTAFSHTLDACRHTLNVRGIQVDPADDDEILGAAAHVESAGLVKVAHVACVEPTVGTGDRRHPVLSQIAARHGGAAHFDGSDRPRAAVHTAASNPHLHATHGWPDAHDVCDASIVVVTGYRLSHARGDTITGDAVDN